MVNFKEKKVFISLYSKDVFHVWIGDSHVFHNVFHSVFQRLPGKPREPGKPESLARTLPEESACSLSLSLSLFLSPWEVKFSSPRPSEPSEARRARLQNIILSGNAYIHEARVRCLRKNTHVQRKPCAPQPLSPFYKVEHGDVECPGACEINTHFSEAASGAE